MGQIEAKTAYEAYYQVRCGRHFNGIQMHSWETLPEEQRRHWQRVADAVLGGKVADQVEGLVPIPSAPIPDAFREAGWSVAVHNDYHMNGVPHTFWLWTHPSGIWVKGEGLTDKQALEQALKVLDGF